MPETPSAKQTEEEAAAPSTSAPEWALQANIYEVNIRQYTPEGTLSAFMAHLGRLRDLGVQILWVMPIQPIGEVHRKGSLGSYYSIQDYTAINPEFGSLADFKTLVDSAHALGMKVILDWVANHTAWDHPWIEAHPEWYTKDSLGRIISPVPDWSDVADLNYQDSNLRQAMLESLRFWIKEADVDGFRCDVAYMVPMDFWKTLRQSLRKDKADLFLLAEAEGTQFYEAFDMTYGWDLHHRMNKVAAGEAPLSTLADYLAKIDSLGTADKLHMYFTTNHDENSWNGTVFERLGANHQNFFVLSATFKGGMPLVYSGQEAGLDRPLDFFAKDSIDWSDQRFQDFYQAVLALKNRHACLKNGSASAEMTIIKQQAEGLFAFRRRLEEKELLVFLNFSASPCSPNGLDAKTQYAKLLSGFSSAKGAYFMDQEIPPHQYLVLEKASVNR